MTEITPQMGSNNHSDMAMPIALPPESIESSLNLLPTIGVSVLTPSAGVGTTKPTMLPQEGLEASISVWENNKRIDGLWSINQNRNVYIHINGGDWEKLANNSDSAIVALNMLGSHAREKNAVVNYRKEGSMILEMYIW